jgi:hypothetical protein
VEAEPLAFGAAGFRGLEAALPFFAGDVGAAAGAVAISSDMVKVWMR